MEYATLAFEIVPDYENKNLKCAKCGETHNVRYKNAEYKGMDVCYCDNCMLDEMMARSMKSKRTTRKTTRKAVNPMRFKSEADYENHMEMLVSM